MDFAALYHFLFETVPGIAVLIGGGLVISVLVSVLLEFKTRRRFRNRPEPEPEHDEWSIFGRDEGEDS